MAAGSAFHVSGTASHLINNTVVFYNGDITIGAENVYIDTNMSVTAFADPPEPVGSVTANAFVHLAGYSVNVFGNITDHATAFGAGNEAIADARLLVDFADVQFNASFGFASHTYGALADPLFSIGELVSYAGARLLDVDGLNLGFYDAGAITGAHTYDGYGAHLSIDAHIGGIHDSLNGVDVEANANAHRTNASGNMIGDAAAHALASATIAGESIQIAGPVKVFANAHGGDGTGTPGSLGGHSSVTAVAKLLTDEVGIVANLNFPTYYGLPAVSYGNDLNTNLRFEAHLGGSFVSFANGIDVEAKASGEDIFRVKADASVHLAAGSFATYGNEEPAGVANGSLNIVVNGPVTVNASANGTYVAVVEANAHLLADVADVKLSATFDGSYQETLGRLVLGDLFISSYALNDFITGNSDVGSFPNVVVEGNMLFEDGLDVEANALGNNAEDVGAVASAELYGHSIGVAGQTNVFACASHHGTGGYEVDAIANLTAAADAVMDSYAGYRVNAVSGEGAFIHFGSSYSGGGTINVGAKVNGSYLGGDGTAEADANVRLVASYEIYVGGPINVTASATGHDGDRVIANAQFAAFGFAASDRSYDSYFNAFREGAGFIFLDPDLNVTAKANGHSVSTVEASAQGLLAAEFIRVDGNVNVMATASGSSAEHIRARAGLIAEGGSYSFADAEGSYHGHFAANSMNFLRPIDVRAKATGSSVSTIEASAAAQFYGYDILIQNQVTVKATASNSGDSSVNDVRSRANSLRPKACSPAS